MKSFVIGQVIEPEIRDRTINNQKRQILNFGLLSGKSCTSIDVFDDSELFDRVCEFVDGEVILAVVNPYSDARNYVKYSLSAVGSCPADLRTQLMSLVAK